MDTYVITGELIPYFREFLAERQVTLLELGQVHGNKSEIGKIRVAKRVMDVVAAEYGVSVHEMKSSDRNRHLGKPRHIAMYLIHKYTGCSYPQVGRLFGGKHHTSCLYANTKVMEWLKRDQDFRFEVGRIVMELGYEKL